ncbi:calcium permeable stress-gated cation channel [Microdochium nivale]|nr:calcium permeable stress-gated cation channel [Microdochium nivale]
MRNDSTKPDLPDYCNGEIAAGPSSNDTYVQLAISLMLGVSAFIAFCIIRPRWKTLYSARKRRLDPHIKLPALPDTLFGWIPALYRITDDQVLASAGLDAFVFLSFFKMAMRLFATMLFFAVTVLLPIHYLYDQTVPILRPPKDPSNSTLALSINNYDFIATSDPTNPFAAWDDDDNSDTTWNWSYLWAYLVFTWFFSGLTLYFMNAETVKVIKIRQDYLGTQRTITDRTFRLVGIPEDLRNESKVKEFVENLEIGHVQSVTLCRDWSEIDGLMVDRQSTLCKLEEAWTVYRSRQDTLPHLQSARVSGPIQSDRPQADEEARESDGLLAGHGVESLIGRPTVRVRFGFLQLRSRVTDALDYYEEKLRRLDEKILGARKKEYQPTNTAFITMSSTAACQMAVQALMDPRPGQLLAKPAPAPQDVVWKNTYAPRYKRKLKSWSITVFISVLSVVWLAPVALLAQLITICNLHEVAPGLADSLQKQALMKALVQTGIPTLIISLFNILVPYLYDLLSNHQGMISQGDVELSVVSKNFFFVFFNIFVVYAISGSAALSNFWEKLRNSFNDTQGLARALATGIKKLNNFYFNFIMLQGIGLLPFKLLQFGSVALYPILRMGSKTPRDFSELDVPALFQYGFYLPTALLVFILCLVYSILPGAYLVLGLGTLYFALGHFIFKYQVLYSMDQPQHATGRAWTMICERIILGLAVFQVTMIGILLLQSAFFAGGLIAPLLAITFWYLGYFRERFTPLCRLIALRSIKRDTDPGTSSHPDHGEESGNREMRLTRRMSTVDENREKGMRYMNPSLFARLEQPWIYRDPPPTLTPRESALSSSDVGLGLEPENGGPQENGGSETRNPPALYRDESETSSFSLGDTHIWGREDGPEGV